MLQEVEIQARVLQLTVRLVQCPSPSRTPGERRVAQLIGELLAEIGGDQLQTGAYPIQGDPYSRVVAWAYLPGASARTVVLMAHYDTVDTADYGELRPWATEPAELRRRLPHSNLLDDLGRRHLAEGEDWLFGRGAADMKAGVAAHLVVLELLCRRKRAGAEPPGGVLLVCTPDEEVESAGMLAAVELLSDLKREQGLEYVGAINTDYHSARFEGDETRAVYLGTVGKLLPSVYVRGVETHVGEPYLGYDANLLCADVVRAVSLRADLADSSDALLAAPPVSLKGGDFKDRYDVQVPFEAHAYFNYLTHRLTPAEALAQVRATVESALTGSVRDIHEQHRRWERRAGRTEPPPPPSPLVLTYAELLAAARNAADEAAVASRLSDLNSTLAAGGVDARVRSVQLVRELWDLSGLHGPAAAVYYSPPYYPHSRGDEHSAFARAVRSVASERGVAVRRVYPYISDASYLSLADCGELSALTANMPLWGDGADPARYSLPLREIGALNLEVANIGVWGHGAHKPQERLHVPYSCGVAPMMVLETLERALGGR